MPPKNPRICSKRNCRRRVFSAALCRRHLLEDLEEPGERGPRSARGAQRDENEGKVVLNGLRLDPEVAASVRRTAARENLTPDQVITELIESWAARRPPQSSRTPNPPRR